MPDEIKISQLPSLSFPITGAESIPFVQSGVTKVGAVSSLNTYLSSTFATISSLNGYAALSTANTFTKTQTFASNSTRMKNVFYHFLPQRKNKRNPLEEVLI
jgi:hypothetical protein